MKKKSVIQNFLASNRIRTLNIPEFFSVSVLFFTFYTENSYSHTKININHYNRLKLKLCIREITEFLGKATLES